MIRALWQRLARGLREYGGTARDAVGSLPDTDDALDPDSPTVLLRRVVALSMAGIPLLLVSFVLDIFEQPWPITAIVGAIVVLVMGSTWWMLDRPSAQRSRAGAMILMLGGLVLLGLLSYAEPDGLSTPFWMALVILIAASILGERAAILITGFAILSMTAAYTFKAIYDPFAPTVFAEVAVGVRRALFLLIILAMGIAARRLTDRQLRALRAQRETIREQAGVLEREVGERRQAQEDLARSLAVVIGHATDGIVTYDADGRVIDVNQAAADLLGVQRNEMPGRQLDELLADQLIEVPEALLAQLTERGGRVELSFAGTAARTTEWAISATRAGDRVVTMAIIRDITERKDLEARLFRQANYDASTGVAKVPHFMRRLDSLMAKGPPSALRGVLAVGVDDLRTVHDGHGWEFTQDILRITADRLTHLVGGRGEVGVFDGVGFLVGVCEPWHERQLADLARSIVTDVAQPIELSGNRVIITASVGIASSTHAGANGSRQQAAADEYVRHAGAALNLARQRGHEQIMRYDENFRAEALNQLELDQALHIAARNREFRLVYQPIVDIRTEKVVGVEALLRWERPGWGLVMPGTFLPRLEATGLIVGVGDWVLREACREMAAWQARLRSRGITAERTMNVNLSALQFMRAGLSETVAAAVRDSRLRPQQLVLEITESVAFDPRAGVLDLMTRLRDTGVRVAIDDFGTGYSSLSQLLRISADVVKLDRSFIDGVTTSGRHRAVVAAMIEVASRLGVPTVAEGVETDEQLAVLREMGCDRAQGYLFARPGALPDT